jgi:hypothetical protein
MFYTGSLSCLAEPKVIERPIFAMIIALPFPLIVELQAARQTSTVPHCMCTYAASIHGI